METQAHPAPSEHVAPGVREAVLQSDINSLHEQITHCNWELYRDLGLTLAYGIRGIVLFSKDKSLEKGFPVGYFSEGSAGGLIRHGSRLITGFPKCLRLKERAIDAESELEYLSGVSADDITRTEGWVPLRKALIRGYQEAAERLLATGELAEGEQLGDGEETADILVITVTVLVAGPTHPPEKNELRAEVQYEMYS
jgi:hypothetical protein